MKKFITNKVTLTLLGIILFLGIWGLTSLIIGNGTRVVPDPFSTIGYSFSLFGNVYLYQCIGMSFLRMIIGFGIAVLLALVLGIIAGNYKRSAYVFNPTMVAMKVVPTAALVYLFMVLLGSKNAPILIVTLITFPIVYESIRGGYASIGKGIYDSLLLERQNFFKKNFLVLFPLAFPSFLVGLASSFALSLKIEIMAEIISGTTSYGLGTAIRVAQNDNPADLLPVFGYSFIAILFMLLLSLLIYFVKNRAKKLQRV